MESWIEWIVAEVSPWQARSSQVNVFAAVFRHGLCNLRHCCDLDDLVVPKSFDIVYIYMCVCAYDIDIIRIYMHYKYCNILSLIVSFPDGTVHLQKLQESVRTDCRVLSLSNKP